MANLLGLSSESPTSPIPHTSTIQMLYATEYTCRSSWVICFVSFFSLICSRPSLLTTLTEQNGADYQAFFQPQVNPTCVLVIWCPLSLSERLHALSGVKPNIKETKEKNPSWALAPSCPGLFDWTGLSSSCFFLGRDFCQSGPLPPSAPIRAKIKSTDKKT